MRVSVRVAWLGILFILSGRPAIAGEIYFPDLGRTMEQAERIKQMRLQNQMMQTEIERQQGEKHNSHAAEAAFNSGYDAGYKQGFDMAISFNIMTTDELRAIRANITEKYSTQSETYQQLVPLIDWRLNHLNTCTPQRK